MNKRVHPEEHGRASKAMELVARARWVRQHRTDSPTAEAAPRRRSSADRCSSGSGQNALEKDMRRRMSLGRASEYNAAAAATRGYEARFLETFVERKVWADAAHGGDRRMHAWTLLNEPSSSRGAMAWAWLILAVVLASIGLLLMRSVSGSDAYHHHASQADALCNLVLAVDWVVRCALFASIERRACCAVPCAYHGDAGATSGRLPGMKALLLDGLAGAVHLPDALRHAGDPRRRGALAALRRHRRHRRAARVRGLLAAGGAAAAAAALALPPLQRHAHTVRESASSWPPGGPLPLEPGRQQTRRFRRVLPSPHQTHRFPARLTTTISRHARYPELPAEYNDAKEESVSALSAALELRRAAQE